MKANPEHNKKDAARSWHRQSKPPMNETARQYALFEFFLSLPPSKRTNPKVAGKFRVSESYIREIRRKRKWNDRAADRDNHLASKADAAAEQVAEQSAFDWAKFEQENLTAAVEMSQLFAARAIEIGKMPITETTETITETTDDGKTLHKTIVHKPLRVTAADAPRFAEAALILSRYAIEQGEAARASGGRENIHLPKPPKPLSEMSPDETASYIAELERARDAMVQGGVEYVSEIGEEQ